MCFGRSNQWLSFSSLSSGSSISINNQSLSINYLLELINKKNQNQITILDVNVQ